MLTIAEQKILKEELTKDEGRRNKTYVDTRGNKTFGIGHLQTGVWSDAVIDLLYEEDWQKAYNFLLKSFAWFDFLNFPRKYVCISMVFEMGEGNFLEFDRFMTAMSESSYTVATCEMLNSAWAKEVPNRVSKLAKIISTGELQKDSV